MDSNQLNREIEAGNFKLPLKTIHREAMLDLVLAWGTLDGALAMLLATVMGLPYHEAADTIGKQSGSGKLAEAIRLIKEGGPAEEAVNFLKKHKKSYERHSKSRNKIAHGHCAGYLTADENFVVFAIFERVGNENLAVDAVPVEEMKRATKWGEAFTSFIVQMLDRLDSEEA
ncbi:hypothetical protein [Rhodovulum steppense]|uniref:hypothetical protein n=1 Tax=Rhodovulum steppense TaxID=540251 RepID=UPI00104ED043|nr:hypothetical protein [Rhodovulum steppense]